MCLTAAFFTYVFEMSFILSIILPYPFIINIFLNICNKKY